MSLCLQVAYLSALSFEPLSSQLCTGSYSLLPRSVFLEAPEVSLPACEVLAMAFEIFAHASEVINLGGKYTFLGGKYINSRREMYICRRDL